VEVAAATFEIGGGAQLSLVGIARSEASARRLFHKRSPWEILLAVTQDSAPRYEKYSHAERADIYRVHLSAEMAAALLKQMIDAAPRTLRKKLTALRPPAAVLFFLPRGKLAGPGTRP
jgi:hypothetical protein